MVEQWAVNPKVEGSNPSRIANSSVERNRLIGPDNYRDARLSLGHHEFDSRISRQLESRSTIGSLRLTANQIHIRVVKVRFLCSPHMVFLVYLVKRLIVVQQNRVLPKLRDENTQSSVRITVSSLGFLPRNKGSIPLQSTKLEQWCTWCCTLV